MKNLPLTDQVFPVSNAKPLMRLAQERLGQAEVDRIVAEEYKINPLGRSLNEYAGKFFMAASGIMMLLSLALILFGSPETTGAAFRLVLAFLAIFLVGFVGFRTGKKETPIEQFASAHLRAQLEAVPTDRVLLMKSSPDFSSCRMTQHILDDIVQRRGEQALSAKKILASSS